MSTKMRCGSYKKQWLVVVAGTLLVAAVASPIRDSYNSCRKTKVAVLGAGMAGITAAQTLHNNSITDFLIVEYKAEIGGRVRNTEFGKDSTGKPYHVELGANWVQGIASPGGPVNPIWTLALKYDLLNTYSNYSSIQTFNASGSADFSQLLADYQTAYTKVEQDAGSLVSNNMQDRSMRSGLSIAGWNPKKDMNAQAAEWWQFDWEYAYPPDQSSQRYAVINYNTTFYQFSNENNYVYDSRGFKTIIKGEASTFLEPNDPRLLVKTIVSSIKYTDENVIVTMNDGSCIEANYAICTFSLGVLQQEVVAFDPPFPSWKTTGIYSMQMGTYTKIFLQFPPDQQFWDADTQFFLYADPIGRGWYPVWQSLSGPGFLEMSGILFVTVVDAQSYLVETQSKEQTLAEVMAVLRTMYPGVKIPDPIDFIYPRWSLEPWAFGSYSNWPPGTSLQNHQNLRANLGRLWFAGEATSTEYFGFLQGAYYEGKAVGTTISACLNGNHNLCKDEPYYVSLRGTTTQEQLEQDNGWFVSSFQTVGKQSFAVRASLNQGFPSQSLHAPK